MPLFFQAEGGIRVGRVTGVQTCALPISGNLSDAVTGGSADAVTFVNNYGLIHPGLNSVSTGPDGIQRTTPIYVAPDAIETGEIGRASCRERMARRKSGSSSATARHGWSR